jgi:tRNA dimethylallyltransferase
VSAVVREATGEGRLLVALYGPTSSGKTALSIDLAERIERELGRRVIIISADSRQVYRYMDIGTSKTTKAEMRGIRHEMIDVLEPIRKLELEDYTRLARMHISKALDADDLPFVVGGTGVYVKALLEGWATEQTGAARNVLRRDFPRTMIRDAYATLRRLDPDTAARLHPNNYEAVINALARVIGGGQQERSRSQGVRRLVLALDPGARTVDQRVAITYDEQVRRGLFGEILDLEQRYDLDRELRRRGPDATNQVLHTHGYREYFELALEKGKAVGELTDADLAEIRGRVLEHIRHYARRQRSFLTKLPRVHRIDSSGQAAALVTGLVGART